MVYPVVLASLCWNVGVSRSNALGVSASWRLNAISFGCGARMTRAFWLAAIAIAIVIASATMSVRAATVTITDYDRTLGSKLAPVTIVEYASPSCPHCARFDVEELPLLRKAYIDRGKVLYVLRVFPRQPVDGAAEGLARCAPAAKYLAAMDLMFRNQPLWDPAVGAADPHGGLVKLAHVMGIDATRADACMSDKSVAQRTNAIASAAVAQYGVHGTPTLVINGLVQPAGVVPWPQLKQLIDRLAR